MHILLVNDDGIDAGGMRALGAAALEAGHRISVCAPDRERSAASHSITLTRPLHARSVAFEGAENAWTVDGKPADCAALGLYLTRQDPVDVVISGVNRGMNLGAACLYSGTVAAAMEASIHGAQALAASLCTLRRDDGDDYGPAARLALRVARWLAAHPLPAGQMLNLNVPALPYDALRGLVAAPLTPVFFGPCGFDAVVEESGAGYRYASGLGLVDRDGRMDLQRTEAGYATLTRLCWDWQAPESDDDLNEIGI